MIRQGITLHRAIDGFTDLHPVWRRSTLHVASVRRRIAGIAVDVIYDHFLCRHWNRFSTTRIEDFAAMCYEGLLSRTPWMEEPARRGVRRMREQDWLTTYREREGIALAFRRMERRSPALLGLADVVDDFTAHYADLEEEFLAYYPEVVSFAARTWAELAAVRPA
jgi:acyl carrier protein phosphodiesterase